MSAYDKVFNISVVFAVVLVGFTAFMGFYIPSVGGSVRTNYDSALGVSDFKVSLNHTDSTGDIWRIPKENRTIYEIGGTEFKIRPNEDLDTHKFRLGLDENVNNNFSTGSYWDGVNDPTDSLFLYESVSENVNPNEFYIDFTTFVSRDNSQISRVMENSTGSSETRITGYAKGSITWGARPMRSLGFRDVVSGMFSFDIPLIPDVFSNIISGLMLFSMGFVVFSIGLLIVPWVG